VAKCRSASVQVAMVTGDHSSTAIAIARQVNTLLSSFGLLGPFPLLSSVLRRFAVLTLLAVRLLGGLQVGIIQSENVLSFAEAMSDKVCFWLISLLGSSAVLAKQQTLAIPLAVRGHKLQRCSPEHRLTVASCCLLFA
jgi:magnesium-transporting ATPase (P-type)